MQTRWAAFLLAAVVAIACYGAVRLVSIDGDALLANVAIDDTLYYAMPAARFAAGEEFGLDGLNRSSGGQPLWSMITTALAMCIGDRLDLVRAMCLLSGLCWITAGVVLFVTLRRRAPMALFIATGWILTGFRERLAFMGMQNGIDALVFAGIVAFAVGPWSRAGIPRRKLLALGSLIGLLTLSRVDCGVLAMLLGAGVLVGWNRVGEPPRLGWQIGSALWLTLPGFILVGGWLAFSVTYFGDWAPISGSAKLLYESRVTEPMHGGVLGSLWWHLWHVFDLGLGLLADHVGRVTSHSLAVTAAVLATAVAVALRRAPVSNLMATWTTLTVGAVVRVGMFATLIPHYTEHGTWYFSLEIMLLWIATGAALQHSAGRLRPRATSIGFTVASIALVAADFRDLRRPPEDYPRTTPFVRAGRWLDQHLPPGQRIGAMSAGYLAMTVTAHRVTNLDGLINTRELLDDYLRRDRLPDYLRREGIRYVADYQPLSTWRRGLTWCGHVPREEMALLKWWRMDGDQAYAIWRLWPEDATDPFDPVSRFEFAAEALGEHRVVSEGELGTLQPPERVACSIAAWPSRTLRHVVVDKTVQPFAAEVGASATFRHGPLELIASDWDPAVERGHRLVLSRRWRLRDAWTGGELTLRVQLVAPDGQPTTVHEAAPCHGTYPVREWQIGELVVETLAADTSNVSPGSYELALAIVVGGQTEHLEVLGDVEVRR